MFYPESRLRIVCSVNDVRRNCGSCKADTIVALSGEIGQAKDARESYAGFVGLASIIVAHDSSYIYARNEYISRMRGNVRLGAHC